MRLITHVRPHLDEICAIWLMRRFADAAGSEVSFVQNSTRPDDVDKDPEVVYIGVGRGKYDEHRGVMGECAASLVWKDLRGPLIAPETTKKAIDGLVAWVLAEDLGQLKAEPHREFSVPQMIDGVYALNGKDSHASLDFGMQALDALFEGQLNRVKLLEDWEQREEIASPFGRGVALMTDAERVDDYAYGLGFDFVIVMNHAGTYRTFRARPEADVDFTPVAEKLEEIDPGANWFLHHSKRLLILGGDHQPDATPSRLGLGELAELVK